MSLELILLVISLVLLVISAVGKMPLWPSVFVIIVVLLIGTFGKR